MRLLTFVCIGFLSIFLSSFDRAIQAQEINPVIASLNSLDELTLRGDHTETCIAALTRFSNAIDKASLDQLREALPLILSAMDSPNPGVRGNALSAMVGINARIGHDRALTGATLPLLDPYVPAIASHLTDPDQRVRGGTVLVLGSFIQPPNTVYPPLIAYLRRDDAITAVGSSVVFELVRIGVTHPDGLRADVEDAVTVYLNRPDQTPEILEETIQSIAVGAFQSQRLDIAILPFIDAPDPILRASTIENLPQLTLPAQNFIAAKAHLQTIAANPNEPQKVRDAANKILSCWVNDRHKPCPIFSLPNANLPLPLQPHRNQ